MNEDKIQLQYLRQADDRYDWVDSLKESTHVLIGTPDYISLLETLKNDTYDVVDPEMESGTVTISKREYASLRNCIRIVRDRATQQIDKATADEHGYKLNYAKEASYRENRKNYKVVEVTKTTPYSVKISLTQAKSMIMEDLYEYYGMIRPENLKYRYTEYDHNDIRDYTPGDIIAYINGDYISSSDLRIHIQKLLAQHNNAIPLKIKDLYADYNTGTYKVTYIATDFI